MPAAPPRPQPPAQRSYRAILRQEIQAGLAELHRPARGLVLSSLSAGLDVGFSVLLMAVVLTAAEGRLPQPVVGLLVAAMYSVGFVLVVLGRSELFTEHTALAVLPVLDGQATPRELARCWALVYCGNLAGAAAFAALVAWFGPAAGILEPWALERIALRLTEHGWWTILVGGVLAGWLMGELAWLLAAGRDTISQVVFVGLVTSAIGLAGLHHSIAGAVEVLAGAIVGHEVGARHVVRFLTGATLGNILGGGVFVALIKYGHATQTSEEESRRPEE